MKLILKNFAGIFALVAILFFFGCSADGHTEVGADSDIRSPSVEDSSANGNDSEKDDGNSGGESQDKNPDSGGNSSPDDKDETDSDKDNSNDNAGNGNDAEKNFFHSVYQILDFECTFVNGEVLNWIKADDGKSYVATVTIEDEVKNAYKTEAEPGSEITEFTFTMGSYSFSSTEQINVNGGEYDLKIGKGGGATTVYGVEAKYGTDMYNDTIPKTIKLAAPLQIELVSTEEKISIRVTQFN